MSFSVKAVHIEAVMDLSAEAFIAYLRRLIARRGKPADVYSDNGTNFVGANNELKAFYDCLQEKDNRHDILDFCTIAGIKWHFSPELAPHFVGFSMLFTATTSGHGQAGVFNPMMWCLLNISNCSVTHGL